MSLRINDRETRSQNDTQIIETSFNYLASNIQRKNSFLNERDNKILLTPRKTQNLEYQENFKEDYEEDFNPVISVKLAPKVLSRKNENPIDETSIHNHPKETDEERRKRELKELCFKRVEYKIIPNNFSQNERRTFSNRLAPLTPKIQNITEPSDTFVYPYTRPNRQFYQPNHNIDQFQDIKTQLSEEILTKINKDLKRIYEMHEELKSIQHSASKYKESYVQTDESEVKPLPMKNLLLDGRSTGLVKTLKSPLRQIEQKPIDDRSIKAFSEISNSPFRSNKDQIFLSPVRRFQSLKPLKKKKDPKTFVKDTNIKITEKDDESKRLPVIDLKIDNNKKLPSRVNKNRKPIDVHSVYSLTDSDTLTSRSDNELPSKPFRLYKIVNDNLSQISTSPLSKLSHTSRDQKVPLTDKLNLASQINRKRQPVFNQLP
jgi:hypothetical protein